MQIVSLGNNLHEKANTFSWKKKWEKKNISKCLLLNFLPSIQSVNKKDGVSDVKVIQYKDLSSMQSVNKMYGAFNSKVIASGHR